jgi:hypothetical protein
MLRIPHCLDIRLTDAVTLPASQTQCALLPRNIYISVTVTHLCYRLCKPQGLVCWKGLVKLIKIIQLIGSRYSDFPACSMVSFLPKVQFNYSETYYCIFNWNFENNVFHSCQNARFLTGHTSKIISILLTKILLCTLQNLT